MLEVPMVLVRLMALKVFMVYMVPGVYVVLVLELMLYMVLGAHGV